MAIHRQRAFWEIACCTMAMSLELSLVLVCLRNRMKYNNVFLLLYKCQNPVLSFATIVGYALLEMGEALKQVAQARDCMDVRVKRTFIDPLQSLQQKELKEIGVSLEYNDVNGHDGIYCIPGFNLLMFRLSVLAQMHLIHSIKALV